MTHADRTPTERDVIDIDDLLARYHDDLPDPDVADQRVAFGTSGHRGTSRNTSFNERHIHATTEAICRERAAQGVTGPLFIGRDTHALSAPAFDSALEVLVAHGVEVRIDDADGFTPTPAISHAILTHNRAHPDAPADGIVVTPSHNPPEDGGFKYNPPHGGPAGSDVTKRVETLANDLLLRPAEIRRVSLDEARAAAVRHPYMATYIEDLPNVVDLEAIAGSGLTLGADPLGGAAVHYWGAIAERFGLDLEVVNEAVDPTFAFMPPDHDGRTRMDCSSSAAMSGLVALAERFDVAFGNDPDGDRHGIVTASAGLLDPNGYLAVMIEHLLADRGFGSEVGIGKTVVSSNLIDRVVAAAGRPLVEVPVGFKWFVDGLLKGELAFGGEESAGASFLRFDGTVWSTDKDGIIACLLAAEMTARDGRDPAARLDALTATHGKPAYKRVDAPASREQKAVLAALSPEDVSATALAGDPITATLTRAPGNDAPIGGLKVATENGWFAARPSGTEDVYKIYAESMQGTDHLERILTEAKEVVDAALAR